MSIGARHYTGLLIAAGLTLNSSFAQSPIRIGPSDDKRGYHSEQYSTNSLSLENRRGTATDLVSIANSKQRGLPDPKPYQEIQANPKQIALGRALFFDRRLSRNKTMSCAMCHIPEQGFTNNELKRPVGFEGRALKRNAPTLLNVVYRKKLFADARESKLSQQVWSPLLANNEMNNASVGAVIDQLLADADYRALFDQAFGEAPNMINIGLAFAQYQQSLIAGDSRFDKWFYGKQQDALNATEIAGFELFQGKAGCASCHLFDQENALFTDHKLHNTGTGYRASMIAPQDTIEVQLAPGITTTLDRSVIDSVGVKKANDLGRYEVTQSPSDRWKFLTPSLRNVGITAPYMHNGEFLDLRSVIEFYKQGGQGHELLSPLIKPLDLNSKETDSLIAFIHTLSSDNIEILIQDAFAATIEDQR